MDITLADDRFSGIGDAPVPQETEVVLSNGVRGTLSTPPSETAIPKIALILHGQAGHRNYCYQRQLAHKLAAELGYHLLRIDFRGCGDLVDGDPGGRILEQDVEDIDAAAEWIKDKFHFAAIVAHSRGLLPMFLWAMREGQRGAAVVPNLVNCSSRFRSHTVYDRYPLSLLDDFEAVNQLCLRFGKIVDVPVTRAELLSLATVDLEPLRDLSLWWLALSIYGLEDTIIPKEDGAHYANTLNRGKYLHHLEVIAGADHNFYGTEPVENAGDAEDFNPHNLPLNRKKLVNYNYLVLAMIIKYLRGDQEALRFRAAAETLVQPWREVDGVANVRDLGGWPVAQPRYGGTCSLRTNYVFRGAKPSKITPLGTEQFARLGISTVFDLRSAGECAKDGVPTLGATRHHVPVFDEDFSPQAIATRMVNLITSWRTYVTVYESILAEGKLLFCAMFDHILNNPNKPFFFHCTAGKDRTGVFAMLLLLFVGVEPMVVAKEYELTMWGLKPDFPEIRAKYLKGLAKIREAMPDAEALIAGGRENWLVERDGFENLISSRHEAMLATIDFLETRYGGVVGYMRGHLGYSDAQLRKIYDNLVVQQPAVAKF